MQPIRSLLALARDLALPPRCAGCGAIVAGSDRFCTGCWSALTFLGPPWCAGCNMPFAHDRGADARCAACLAAPPAHAGVRAAVAYGAVARTLALRLKYAGRVADARTAAALMQRHLPADADLVVPVPLHWRRLWWRGYNQAALIAAHLARAGGVAFDPAAIERQRATPVLRGRSPRARQAAVRGAFRIAAARAGALVGRHVVLVDDVYTSGATTDACVRVLRRAGARRVTILAWARVIADGAD
jgi:ComF family protein